MIQLFCGRPSLKGILETLATVGWLLMFGLVCYWLVESPILITSQKVELLSPVHVGDRGFQLRTAFCEPIAPVPGTLVRTIRQLDTGNAFVLSMEISVATAGCYDLVRFHILPRIYTNKGDTPLPAGRYEYQFCAQYQINPLRQLRGCTHPLNFDILPNN